MKRVLQLCAIWLLRRTNCTVVIGAEIQGSVQALNSDVFVFDNRVYADFKFSDGHRFELPTGKFRWRGSLR